MNCDCLCITWMVIFVVHEIVDRRYFGAPQHHRVNPDKDKIPPHKFVFFFFWQIHKFVRQVNECIPMTVCEVLHLTPVYTSQSTSGKVEVEGKLQAFFSAMTTILRWPISLLLLLVIYNFCAQ